jgi:type IX secretion system PorP/SprF family membrane protein
MIFHFFKIIKMKKNIYILIFILASINSVFAQQENHYTMFMYNKIMYNPAFAGAREVPSVLGLYRNQWISFKGAPSSQLLNFDVPLGKTRASIGAQVSHHTIGIQRNIIGNLAYSYAIMKTKTTSLRFGINGTYNNYTYDFSDPTLYIRDAATSDPSIVDATMYKLNRGNFGAGVYFDHKGFYVGVSAPNLLQNTLGSPTSLQQRHIYGMMGALIPLNSKLQLRPAFSARFVQHASVSFDANVMLIIAKKIHFGGSYRLDSQIKSESADLLSYFQLTNRLGVGVSYDLSVNGLMNQNKGSIEALVRYDLADPNGVKGKFDNPRFFF